MLELQHISYETEENREILHDISLTIQDRFVAITGPNGGGKSTLAKIIAGIYTPTSGRILLDGEDITALSVFDEPEAGIDLWSFQNLIRVFEKMYEQTRGSILIISHQERILNIADTIVLLKDGRLAECGPREEVLPRLLRNIDTAPPVCSMLSDPIKEVR